MSEHTDHVRATFERACEQFLALGDVHAGSVTMHFADGEVRKVEWRMIDDVGRRKTLDLPTEGVVP